MKAKSNSSTGVSKIVRTLPCPLAKLLPPKHRKALLTYLEHPRKVYRVTGGRGALKTSFATVLSTVLLQSESPHGDILFLTASRFLARYASDQFNWLFTQRFPTAYISPNGSWRMEYSPTDKIFSWCFHGELKDAKTSLPTFHYYRRVHFLPLDCVHVVRRFLAAKTDYSLLSEYLALPPKTKPTARQKKDLIAIIDDLSRSPRQRLDALIAYKKKHLGLVGFHMTCCAKKPLTENERIVSFLRLERGILTGAIKERDVTNEQL